VFVTSTESHVLVYSTWAVPLLVILFVFDFRIERHNRRVFLQQQMVAFRYRKHLRKTQETNQLVEKTALPEVGSHVGVG
jgi:hypothetical protein